MNDKERAKEVKRLRKIGKLGGKATVEKHGKEHMASIASKGGQKRWAKS